MAKDQQYEDAKKRAIQAALNSFKAQGQVDKLKESLLPKKFKKGGMVGREYGKGK